MKNQFFSIQRFITYGKCNFKMNANMYLLQLLGMCLGIFLFVLIGVIKDNNWSSENWAVTFGFTGSVFSLLFIGYSFSSMRKREGVMNYLLLPASTFEKFIFEFLLRFVVFFIIYTIALIVFGNLAYSVGEYVRLLDGRDMGNSQRLLESFSEADFSKFRNNGLWIFVSVAFLSLSTAFAGAIVFKKNPLVKTTAFVMSVTGAAGYYFYTLFEKIHIDAPFFAPYFNKADKAEIIPVVSFLIAFMAVWIFVFAFYKLKEKEV